MIKIYGIKNCDSVKKALSFLKKHDLEYELHDFKSEPISCDRISSWLKTIDMKTLFNSRSTTYRNFKLKEMNLNDSQKKEWLCKENLLIKRPVVEYKDNVIVGFNKENFKGVFL